MKSDFYNFSVGEFGRRLGSVQFGSVAYLIGELFKNISGTEKIYEYHSPKGDYKGIFFMSPEGVALHVTADRDVVIQGVGATFASLGTARGRLSKALEKPKTV